MSFSTEQKKTILEKTYKSRCCRSALLSGAMFARAYDVGGVIQMSVGSRESCEFVARLIREFYGKNAEIKRAEDGGRRYIMSFSSASASAYINGIDSHLTLFDEKCESCQSAFLRGVFLLSARASDPRSGYSIHFSLADRAECFAQLLTGLELSPHIFNDASGDVVYLKDSSSIESFFGHAGMNKAMFSLIDARLEGEIRKNVARVSNCETNNIKKAVDAAVKQYDIILALERANLLSSLPEDLETTARLRLMHKEMSLSQLAAIATPPISKPGLSHRLKKITQIGERLLERTAEKSQEQK